jgi:hypothetical protein
MLVVHEPLAQEERRFLAFYAEAALEIRQELELKITELSVARALQGSSSDRRAG